MLTQIKAWMPTSNHTVIGFSGGDLSLVISQRLSVGVGGARCAPFFSDPASLDPAVALEVKRLDIGPATRHHVLQAAKALKPVGVVVVECAGLYLKGEAMALISDIAAIGTSLLVVVFSVWMVKQLFTDKN